MTSEPGTYMALTWWNPATTPRVQVTSKIPVNETTATPAETEEVLVSRYLLHIEHEGNTPHTSTCIHAFSPSAVCSTVGNRKTAAEPHYQRIPNKYISTWHRTTVHYLQMIFQLSPSLWTGLCTYSTHTDSFVNLTVEYKVSHSYTRASTTHQFAQQQSSTGNSLNTNP